MQNYYNGFRNDQSAYYPILPKRILEIGGGDGENRKNFNCEVEYWLIEPNLESATSAKNIVTNVYVGTYDEVSELIPDGYFDLIICNDVIEHIPNWSQFLINIQNKLTDTDSVLIGSIPNIRFFHSLYILLMKKDWPYERLNGGIFDITHLAFFTLISLTNELIYAKFKINKISLERKFKYTKNQNKIKYLITLIFIAILGKDSAYSHIYFSVSKIQ